jgi:S1-C subfamily serine protease
VVTACGIGSTVTGSSRLGSQYVNAVQSELPSVVQITTSSATGSGVVYDKNGDIVTNAHVVGNATSMKVTSATGGATMPAHLIGLYTPDDLAVLRVDGHTDGLRPAAFGDSGQVEAGEIVLAMGNPLGLTGTVTQGIISATGRTISETGAAGQAGVTLANAIQTSAAINSGNSGGPLINLDHQVIGITTAAARDPQAGIAPGIGFAIPSNTAKNIADQLIARGRVTSSGRAALGISARSIANEQGQPAGVGIVDVSGAADGPAGLHPGDVVVAVNGIATDSVPVLDNLLAGLKPGDRVEVTYVRDGARHKASVTLGTLAG